MNCYMLAILTHTAWQLCQVLHCTSPVHILLFRCANAFAFISLCKPTQLSNCIYQFIGYQSGLINSLVQYICSSTACLYLSCNINFRNTNAAKDHSSLHKHIYSGIEATSMKIVGLLAVCIGAISAMTISHVKVRCELSNKPWLVFKEERNILPYMLTSENLPATREYLRVTGIMRAYVFSWNGEGTVSPFVVEAAAGTVTPFNPVTNTADYILCAGECPCPMPGTQGNAGQIINTSREKYLVRVESANRSSVNPCFEDKLRRCEEDSSCSEADAKCYEFASVKKEKCAFSSGHRRFPNKKFEITSSLKKFVFDIKTFHRKGETIVKVTSNSNKEKVERFVISKNGEIKGTDNKKCKIDPLPRCLKNPRKLYRLKKCIERMLNNTEVCMYINDKCEIFIVVPNGRACVVYKVIVKGEGEGRKEKIRISKQIRGDRLRELIKCGLFGVEFGSIDCN
ncbi:hypothetical protein HK407_01g00670 [Ordospora pajunii]|uniref:uncharacterized protein n=1 Tax=Ordospora pajunii TaxID=3039483 RepID=UPI00295291C3|nr:uncharacterized protein HK407_01g00670 [Ordospora pajunii]KAH9412174.1 hypothetical protein HK407_01g00670 [Ordospora pajunii]